MTLYDAVSDLPLRIDGYECAYPERETSSGFTRTTTVVSLSGDGKHGRGEDVTYDSEAHYALRDGGDDMRLDLTGAYTVDSFSERLSKLDLFFGKTPEQSVFRNYRRWAFESAALDLALKQAETNLAKQLNRAYEPVRFVVSTRLGEPPSAERIDAWLSRDSNLEFKLDPTPEWTEALAERLAATEAVRILDLKGLYEGTTVDQDADPALYESVLETFPDALIEDPKLTDETRPLFRGHESRVTWDYPIRDVESVESLPWEPEYLNIKPSRFGSIRSLLDALEYCQRKEIRCFGGGQFELDVGRQHLHALASLFYPDAPNDVAPSGYNDPEPENDLPSSPLSPPDRAEGIEWD